MDSCIFEFEAVDMLDETKKDLLKKKKKKKKSKRMELTWVCVRGRALRVFTPFVPTVSSQNLNKFRKYMRPK